MTGMESNEAFSKMLKALIASDFVVKYVPFGMKKTQVHYKLVDPFCWFWLHFKEQKQVSETDFWEHHLNETLITSWCGIAFEEICFTHIPAIKKALGISGVSTEVTAMTVKGDNQSDGMQIDMLIYRRDDVINLCEIKYCKEQFTIDKQYAEHLRSRKYFVEKHFPKKAVHQTFITTYGLSSNAYANEVTSQITMDDLFEH